MELLIASDAEGDPKQLEKTLQRIDVDLKIFNSHSIKKGLKLIRDKDIDLVIFEHSKPDLDTLEFLDKTNDVGDLELPFLIISKNRDEEVIKKALDSGTNGYLIIKENLKDKLKEISTLIEKELYKKKIREELKDSEKKYRSLLNQAAEMLFLHDTDGNIIEVNQAAIDNTGYSRDELLQMNIFDIDHDAKGRGDMKKYWKELTSQDPPIKVEVRHKRKDGSIYHADVLLSKVILSDEEYIFALARDITERTEAQKKIEEEQRRRKMILNNIPGNAFILKKESREIVFSNKKAKESGAAPGKTCYETIADRDDPCPFCQAPKLWKTGEKQEIEAEYRDLHYRGIWIPYTEDEYIHYIYDITERKETENKVRKTKDKIEKLHKISAELETCQSEEEVFNLAVDAAEDILDFDLCSFSEVEEDKFIVKKRTSGLPKGDYRERSLKEGGIDTKTYQNQRSYVIKNVNKNKDAKPVSSKYKSAMSIPIGEYGVFQAVATEENFFDEDDLNTTELLIDEITSTLKRMDMRERGEFLHSLLRHDVRNKSVLVQGYLDLAEDFDLPEEAEKYIRRAKSITENGMNIIDKVRKLRKIKEKKKIIEVKIKSILDRVISDYDEELKQHDINLELDGKDLTVEGGVLLEDLFSNLIENSIQHSNCNKVNIDINSEKDRCVVTIEDDGKGIKDEDKDTIFEKGYKYGDGGGTGLGMYIVKQIADNYDGNIDLKDSEMGGARFDIKLNTAD